MSQLTAEQAKAKLLVTFPTRTIHWTTPSDGFWYICATDPKDPDEGQMNPYFKVNATTGDLSEFYVTSNLALFEKILSQVVPSL